MNLDRCTVVLRQRSAVEICDLAVLVSRQHGWHLIILTLVGCGPWALLDWWLIGLRGRGEDTAGMWFPLLLLLAVQVPAATAPITTYLGTALFDERPRVWVSLWAAWKRLPALIGLGIVRGLFALIPPILLVWTAHAVEALLLEGQGLRGAWKRAGALRGAGSGAGAGLLMLAVPVLVAAVVLIAGTLEAILGALLHADPWQIEAWTSILQPASSWATHLALWIGIGYLAVVRFFAYIDLRTRAEGWAIDLDLRRTAARLEVGG